MSPQQPQPVYRIEERQLLRSAKALIASTCNLLECMRDDGDYDGTNFIVAMNDWLKAEQLTPPAPLPSGPEVLPRPADSQPAVGGDEDRAGGAPTRADWDRLFDFIQNAPIEELDAALEKSGWTIFMHNNEADKKEARIVVPHYLWKRLVLERDDAVAELEQVKQDRADCAAALESAKKGITVTPIAKWEFPGGDEPAKRTVLSRNPTAPESLAKVQVPETTQPQPVPSETAGEAYPWIETAKQTSVEADGDCDGQIWTYMEYFTHDDESGVWRSVGWKVARSGWRECCAGWRNRNKVTYWKRTGFTRPEAPAAMRPTANK